jgi:hypothetical protein
MASFGGNPECRRSVFLINDGLASSAGPMNANAGSAACNGGAVVKTPRSAWAAESTDGVTVGCGGRDGGAVWFGWGILTCNLDRLVIRESAHG